MVVASEALPETVPKPLSGGWALRSGVFTKQEPTASIDKGVFIIEGGGYRGGTWVRGTVVPADRAQMTAAFVYKALKGDFILTARRIAYDKRKAHQNCGNGLVAIGDLKGWDCPVAVDASAYGDKPFWYRMIHKGDRIGLYEGPDGQKWMASNAGALIAGTIYAGLYTEGWDEQTMAQYDNVTIDKHVPLPQPCTAAECSRFSRWRPPNVCQEAADTSRRSGQSVHTRGIPRRPQYPRQGRQVRCLSGAVPAMVRF